MNDRLPELLAARLRHPLPGPGAGGGARAEGAEGRRHGDRPPDARPAAVLLLLYPHHDRWHLPLTLRPEDLANHAGQVSLPGGAVEPGETDRQAAVREFHEELGAPGHPITMLGRLSPIYVRASNFLIAPWVAVTDHRPAMAPNPAEVAELVEVPLDHLLDPANVGSIGRQSGGRAMRTGCFRWQSHRIWGATFRILGELVALLRELGAGV